MITLNIVVTLNCNLDSANLISCWLRNVMKAVVCDSQCQGVSTALVSKSIF